MDLDTLGHFWLSTSGVKTVESTTFVLQTDVKKLTPVRRPN